MFANRPLPQDKCAHHFDFDQTLTKKHVNDFGKKDAPTKEACKTILKPEVLETFRAIWSRGDYISIISNGTGTRITHILMGAGLTASELGRISLHAAASKSIATGFKANAIAELEKKWSDATYHYFYDDKKVFRDEVDELVPSFEMNGKHLKIIAVSTEKDYVEHLLYAQEISGISSELNGEVNLVPEKNSSTMLIPTNSLNSFQTTSVVFFSSSSGAQDSQDAHSAIQHKKRRHCTIL